MEAWEKAIRDECKASLMPCVDAVVVQGSVRDLALLEDVLLGATATCAHCATHCNDRR